jgi:hypothetical protein
MTQKNRLLYPLVIGAVVSVTTFSCLGIAAITGHLPVGQGAVDPFIRYTADGATPGSVVRVEPVVATHVGLTRQRDMDPVPASRPLEFRRGQRIAQSACPTCGVIHSIEAGAAGVAPTAAESDPDGQSPVAARVMRAMHSRDGAGPELGTQEANFVVRVKMEDGTVRTIYEIQRPHFSIGERVRLVNGSIISQS